MTGNSRALSAADVGHDWVNTCPVGNLLLRVRVASPTSGRCAIRAPRTEPRVSCAPFTKGRTAPVEIKCDETPRPGRRYYTVFVVDAYAGPILKVLALEGHRFRRACVAPGSGILVPARSSVRRDDPAAMIDSITLQYVSLGYGPNWFPAAAAVGRLPTTMRCARRRSDCTRPNACASARRCTTARSAPWPIWRTSSRPVGASVASCSRTPSSAANDPGTHAPNSRRAARHVPIVCSGHRDQQKFNGLPWQTAPGPATRQLTDLGV